jgi:hypothetical protein
MTGKSTSPAPTFAQLQAAAELENTLQQIQRSGLTCLLLAFLAAIMGIFPKGPNAGIWRGFFLLQGLLLGWMGIWQLRRRSPGTLRPATLLSTFACLCMIWFWLASALPHHALTGNFARTLTLEFFRAVSDHIFLIFVFADILLRSWRAGGRYAKLEAAATPESQSRLEEMLQCAQSLPCTYDFANTVELRAKGLTLSLPGGTWKLVFDDEAALLYRWSGDKRQCLRLFEHRRLEFKIAKNRPSGNSKIVLIANGKKLSGRYTISPAMLERLRGLATELPEQAVDAAPVPS